MRKICAAIMIIYLFTVGIGVAESALMLPSSLSCVEEEAFYGNVAINEVILPEGVLEIGKRAFANSGLKRINLPQSITFIAEDAFEGCNLTKVTAFGQYATQWCKDHNITIQSDDPYVGEEYIIP